MPKLARDVSHDRRVRFLARRGWTVVRAGGRHTILTKHGDHVAVPRHNVLKVGTVAAILTQCGVTHGEWRDL